MLSYSSNADYEEVDQDPEAIAECDLDKALSHPLWLDAVRFLHQDMPHEIQEEARVMRKLNPSGWMTPYHFTTGMYIRNRLRENGFSEGDFGIQNLDNIYVALVNEALDW